MEVLVFLVPLALALGLIGLMGFLWSLKNGQYDDLEGAGWRANGMASRLAKNPRRLRVDKEADPIPAQFSPMRTNDGIPCVTQIRRNEGRSN